METHTQDLSRPAQLPNLGEWLAQSDLRCRMMRWLGAAFRFKVASDSATIISQVAYTAEQADREAMRALKDALADGHLDDSDMPKVQAALAHCGRSADHDAAISEATAA